LVIIRVQCFAGNKSPAKIWGFEGEAWKTELLLDYSFTGFAAKERGFPEPPFAANILDFGAIGDGVVDCTGALFTSSQLETPCFGCSNDSLIFCSCRSFPWSN